MNIKGRLKKVFQGTVTVLNPGVIIQIYTCIKIHRILYQRKKVTFTV